MPFRHAVIVVVVVVVSAVIAVVAVTASVVAVVALLGYAPVLRKVSPSFYHWPALDAYTLAALTCFFCLCECCLRLD